jgi:RsiW-degrading membrane proteinase PrsW (M82 family)
VPSWQEIAIGLLAPLALLCAAPVLRLAESPKDIAFDFGAGVALAFSALVAEDYAFNLIGPLAPIQYRLVIETFFFVALTEEILKIGQIVQLAEHRNARSLREIISIALVVTAGFAGAENVIYLFRYADNIEHLLLIRILTAVPMHLATAVVSAHFIFIARKDGQHSHYYVIALIVATTIHGMYDFLNLASRGRSLAFLFVLGFVVAWAWRIAPRRA